MKKITSRRLFLQKSAIATTGVALLSSGLANALTTECPFAGYNPYVEEKTDLRISLFGREIKVNGTLYDKSTGQPIQNATIEVWHLSQNSTKFRNRGQLKTNSSGDYNFISNFPNKPKDKAARVYFKVSHAGKTDFTELVLNNTGAHISAKHWETNQNLGKKLFPKTNMFLGDTQIEFNLSI